MNTNFFHNRPKKNNTFRQLLESKRENIDMSKEETCVILKAASKCSPTSSLKSFEIGYTRGVKDTVQNYSAVLLLCLKDKFGFTSEQLKDVAGHIDETFDAINEEYLSLNDIIQTLKEEDDLDVRFKKELTNER